MGDTHDNLRELVELCTQEAPRGLSIQNRYQWDDARAYEALRFIQKHGPALLARQEGEDARDAARYRWLAEKIEAMDGDDTMEVLSRFGMTYSWWPGFTELVDAARSGGGGG